MKKLHLDGLKVDSFTTSPAAPRVRGTVVARENTGTGACPISWDGTCWVTCWDSCYCETEWEC
jgi:outer membrane protein assembly factor BamB